MSPYFLRGSNSIHKSDDGLFELKAFVEEQKKFNIVVSTHDRKIFVEGLYAQRKFQDSIAFSCYSDLSNRYNSDVLFNNIEELDS